MLGGLLDCALLPRQDGLGNAPLGKLSKINASFADVKEMRHVPALQRCDRAVLLLPGASMLDVSRSPAGVVTIHCPGCDDSWSFDPAVGDLLDVTLRHDDDCSVLARIRAAEGAGRN